MAKRKMSYRWKQQRTTPETSAKKKNKSQSTFVLARNEQSETAKTKNDNNRQKNKTNEANNEWWEYEKTNTPAKNERHGANSTGQPIS